MDGPSWQLVAGGWVTFMVLVWLFTKNSDDNTNEDDDYDGQI